MRHWVLQDIATEMNEALDLHREDGEMDTDDPLQQVLTITTDTSSLFFTSSACQMMETFNVYGVGNITPEHLIDSAGAFGVVIDEVDSWKRLN